VIPVENARTEERARRYVIDADVLRRVEREATDNGLDVIGFYHSHPDHPAVPSTFDREHSWPWYTYIILSVRSGDVVDTRAWQLSDDRSRFRQITVVHPVTSPRNQPQKPAPETRL
jgi:proteasome lid subunit RPN8/RPN11